MSLARPWTRDYDFFFNCGVVGDQGCGGTSLLQRLMGVDEGGLPRECSMITFDSRRCKLAINRVKSHEPLEGLSGFVVVFDLTCESSFRSARMWLKLRRFCDGESPSPAAVIVVGTKSDLPRRVVPFMHGEALAHSYGAPYIEASAHSGHCVADVQWAMLQTCLTAHTARPSARKVCVDVRVPSVATTVLQPGVGCPYCGALMGDSEQYADHKTACEQRRDHYTMVGSLASADHYTMVGSLASEGPVSLLSALPRSLILVVCSHLDVPSLGRMARTCTTIRSLLLKPKAWERAYRVPPLHPVSYPPPAHLRGGKEGQQWRALCRMRRLRPPSCPGAFVRGVGEGELTNIVELELVPPRLARGDRVLEYHVRVHAASVVGAPATVPPGVTVAGDVLRLQHRGPDMLRYKFVVTATTLAGTSPAVVRSVSCAPAPPGSHGCALQ